MTASALSDTSDSHQASNAFLKSILQTNNKSLKDFSTMTSNFLSALRDLPASCVLWIKYIEHLTKGIQDEEDIHLDDHITRIEDALKFSINESVGVWGSLAKLLMAAGRFAATRECFQRAFRFTQKSEHRILWKYYIDLIKENTFISDDMRIAIYQQAILDDPKCARDLFNLYVQAGSIDSALRILVDHSKILKEDPLDFLRGHPESVSGSIVVEYLQFEKSICSGDLHRLQTIYVSVIEHFEKTNQFNELRQLLHTEVNSSNFDLYPFLCEQYVAFEERCWSATKDSKGLIAYEAFVDDQAEGRLRAFLKSHPDSIPASLSWLKLFENKEEDFLSKFDVALENTKASPFAETLWVRLAFWHEMKGNISEARAVYELAFSKIDFTTSDSLVTLVENFIAFLLRQDEWKTAIGFLRKLTATNADSIHSTRPNRGVKEEIWRDPRIWSTYIDVCEKHSIPDATAFVYERMISLDLADESMWLRYIHFLTEKRALFGRKSAQALRDALYVFPSSLELWNKYIIQFLDTKHQSLRVEAVVAEFLRNQKIESIDLQAVLPVDLQVTSTSITPKNMCENYGIDDLLLLRNIFSNCLRALKDSTHGYAQMYFALVRVDLLFSVLSGFDTASHHTNVIILDEFLDFARKNEYADQIESILQELRNDVDEYFTIYPEKELSGSLFAFLVDLAELQSHEALRVGNVASARQVLTSFSKCIARLKNIDSAERFWAIWMEFEERYGTEASVSDMHSAWADTMTDQRVQVASS